MSQDSSLFINNNEGSFTTSSSITTSSSTSSNYDKNNNKKFSNNRSRNHNHNYQNNSRNNSHGPSPPLPPGVPPMSSNNPQLNNNYRNNKRHSNYKGNRDNNTRDRERDNNNRGDFSRDNKSQYNNPNFIPHPPSHPPSFSPVFPPSQPPSFPLPPPSHVSSSFSYPVPPNLPPHPSLYQQQYIDPYYSYNNYNQNNLYYPRNPSLIDDQSGSISSGSSLNYNLSSSTSPASTTSSASSITNEWKEYTTAEGKIYYSNGITSVWEMPSELKEKSSFTSNSSFSKNNKQEDYSDNLILDMDTKEAEEHFENLLFEKNVSHLSKFKEIQDMCCNDKRWNYLKSIGEKKQKIAEYQTKKKNLELSNKKKIKLNNIKQFYIMLTEKNFNINLSYKKNCKLFYNDSRFKAIENEYEREELYNDYVKELYNKKLINYNNKKLNFFYYYIKLIKKFFFNIKNIKNYDQNEDYFNEFYSLFSSNINYYNNIDNNYEIFSYNCNKNDENKEKNENHSSSISSNNYYHSNELKLIFNNTYCLIKFFYFINKDRKNLRKFYYLKYYYIYNLINYLNNLILNNYIKYNTKISDIILFKDFQESFYYIKLHTIYNDLVENSSISNQIASDVNYYDEETQSLKFNMIPNALDLIFNEFNQFNDIDIDYNKIYNEFKDVFDRNYTVDSNGASVNISNDNNNSKIHSNNNKAKIKSNLIDIRLKSPEEIYEQFNNEIREICEIVLKKYLDMNKILLKFLNFLKYYITYDTNEEDFITYLLLNLKKNKRNFLKYLLSNDNIISEDNIKTNNNVNNKVEEEEGEEGEENENYNFNNSFEKKKNLTKFTEKDLISYDISFHNYLKYNNINKDETFLNDIIDEEDDEIKEFYSNYYKNQASYNSSSSNFLLNITLENYFFDYIENIFNNHPNILSQYFTALHDDAKLKYIEEVKLKKKQKKNFLLLIHEVFLNLTSTSNLFDMKYEEFILKVNKRSAYQLLTDEEIKLKIYNKYINTINEKKLNDNLIELDLNSIQYDSENEDIIVDEIKELNKIIPEPIKALKDESEEGEISEDGEIIEDEKENNNKRSYSYSLNNDDDRKNKK